MGALPWDGLLLVLFSSLAAPHLLPPGCLFNVTTQHSSSLFDLSVLPDSWISVPDKGLTVYFNLCPRAKKSPCGSNDSLICFISDGSTNVIDAGSTLKNVSHSSGVLSVELVGKSKCNETDYYSTTFLLSCSGENEEHPSFIKTSECTSDVIWKTFGGCPRKEVSINNSCIWVAQNNSYDLRALYRPSGFKTHFDGDEYFVSICGPLKTPCSGDNVAVCRVGIDGAPVPLAYSNSSQLTLSTHTPLTLTYYTNLSEPQHIQIVFLCESGTVDPQLKPAIVSTPLRIKFEMRTSIVCQPAVTSCETSDPNPNYKYDLNPLSKYVQNVEIRLANKGLLLFNLCKSLVFQEERYCTGGNVMGCLVNGTSVEALATYHKPPVVVDDHLSVVFEGGQECQGSTSRLEVNLYCSSDSTAQVVESSQCFYKVQWNSTYACRLPVSQGDHCTLKESFNDQILDFNSLYNPKTDYISERSLNESYRVNLCRPLNAPCNGEKNVSVCWKEGDVERAIGRFNDKPVFSNGQTFFEMEGEPCSNVSKKSIVTIIMPCDYDAVNSKPEMVSKVCKDFYCQFYFLWKSSKACTDRIQFNCTLQTSSHLYDLRPLVNTKGNYEVKYNDSVIYINVCHSIVLSYWVSCGKSMGACIVNKTVTEPENRKTDLGAVSTNSRLLLRDDRVVLTYNDGSPCRFSKQPTHSTSITFICNRDKNFTYPKLVNVDGCHYSLEWETMHACPKPLSPSVIPHQLPTLPPFIPSPHCSLDIPNTDITIDLRDLTGKDWPLEGRDMWLSVCGPLANQHCPEGSGFCRRDQGTAYTGMGEANNRLFLSDGGLTLNYTDNLGQMVITRFICSFRDVGPLWLKDIDHRVTLLSWPTPLACMYHVDKYCCGESRGPLCHLSGVHPIRLPHTNQTLYLSVCSELEIDGVSHCHGTSGACLVSQGNIEKNLGYPTMSPLLGKSGSITIMYTNGDVCSEPGFKYSTRVDFICDPSKLMGSPVLLNLTHDCQYQLVWRTSLVCQGREEGEGVHLSTCLKEETAGFPQVILTPHSPSLPLKVWISGIEYRLTFCHKRTPMCPTHVCSHGNSPFAELTSITYRKAKNSTIFFFKYIPSGHPLLQTPHNECGAEVRVICDPTKTESAPIGMMINMCLLKIVWETPLGCELPSKTALEELDQESHSYKVWLIVSVLVTAITGLLFVITLRKRNGVMGFFNGRVSYSRDFSGERAKLHCSDKWYET